ncbi:MAG TPA: tetratricopeptide repeat protein [Xanthobacteraceae bacterium]|nr:tetratricopeptide repeat protein [Xanthobacteraceae bacterium]
MAFHAAGRFADMEAYARRLLKSLPGHALLHELLGIALSAQGRHSDALPQLERAVHRAPGDAQFWENLGLCQQRLEHFTEAETSLRRALALRPFSVEALNALGTVLKALHRTGEAEQVLRQALSLAPTHAAIAFNLGNTLRDLGRIPEAEASYRRAISANPSDPAAYANLALLLRDSARFEEARAMAQRVVDLCDAATTVTPAVADALDVAGSAFAGTGRAREAVALYKKTKSYQKSLPHALAAVSAARAACDWTFAAEIGIEEKIARASTRDWAECDQSPFTLLMLPGASAANQLSAARGYAQKLVPPSSESVRSTRSRQRGGRLRLGYVSGDLRDHAVAYLAVRTFELHDRNRFEVIAYDYSPPSDSAFRARLVEAFDRVVPLNEISNHDAARRIAEDECDVAIDLTGWTQRNRSKILSYRPAPVQVQWLGYPGTLGAPWIDYIVADRTLVPPGEEELFSEKIIRLPHTYQPTDDRRAIAPPRTRSDDALPNDAFVFCSFNQAYKITPDVFDTWMKLLNAVDGSVLWLLGGEPEVAASLRSRAVAGGVSGERIVFASFVSNAEHLARIGNADLALDCSPYGSHTTTSDALWAGVPLVALAGHTFASRVSSSILRAAGFPDLVSTSLDDYFDLALRLAMDRERMSALRARIAASRSSPLFDTVQFTRTLEAAYEAVWTRHMSGLLPDHIAVA